MPALDWFFLGVLLLSMVVGAWRGLVYEILSVVAWLAAFFLAQWFAADVAQWLPMSNSAQPIRYAAGFALVFVGTVFAGSLVAFVVKKLIAAAGLRPADRLMGAAFGVIRGAVLLLAVTVVVGMTPLHASESWSEASGPRVASVALSVLKPVLPDEFGKYLP
jgi:membrane protein required for colicin V production